jgi:hypothetical protein
MGLLGLGVLFSLLACTYSIYSDQVGMFDWSIKNFGKISYAGILPSTQANIVVRSEANIIGAMTLSGVINWRTSPYNGEPITNFVLHSGYVVTTSLTEISVWAALSGKLIWNQHFAGVTSVVVQDSLMYVCNDSEARTYKIAKGLQTHKKALKHKAVGIFVQDTDPYIVEQREKSVVVHSLVGNELEESTDLVGTV